MADKAKIKDILDRNKILQQYKAKFRDLLQLCGEYVHQLSQDFTGQNPEGTMLNKNVFDSTAPKCARKTSSAFIGMLWQNGAKSMQLQPPKDYAEINEVKEYFDKVTDNVREDFDDPRAGFSTALEETMNEEVSFGTAGFGTFEGSESTLLFECWNIDGMEIDEGEGGVIDTTHKMMHWPLKRVIQTYGVENLSAKLQDLARKSQNLDTKVKILYAIEPRKIDRREVLSNMNMPCAAYHIEVETEHCIREGGFEEMPVKVARFYKKAGEKLGRSMAMDAMPAILEINAAREMRMLAQEKKLDPPLGVYSDSILGNGKLDTSAGGTSVMNPKARGKLGGPPVFALFDIGDIREADKQIDDLKKEIAEHFFNDRLLDFNNTTEMTLGEAQMRQAIRGEGIGPIFSRLINELLTPTIERGVSICFRKGRMGVVRGSIEHRYAVLHGEQPLIIPDVIARLIQQGKEFYEIKYFTPAARIMEAEEATGIMDTVNFAAQLAQQTQNPELFDGIDLDKAIETVARVRGAPSRILKSVERREGIRQARGQIMEEKAQLEQAQQMANVAETASNIKPDAA